MHHLSDDDVIQEETAAEAQTTESSSDLAVTVTDDVSDSVDRAASSEQPCVDSQQDIT